VHEAKILPFVIWVWNLVWWYDKKL